MTQLKLSAALIFFVFSANYLAAQGKPELKSIEVFNSDGVQIDTTSNGQITVQLKFNRQMDPSVNPEVRFGLQPPFDFAFSGIDGWVAGDTLWQGTLNINENIPPSVDGEYIFQVSGAEDAFGVRMDTTLSTQLGTTLYVCRAGLLELQQSSLDFGRIRLGTATTMPLTVGNTSCAELVISAIVMEGPFSLLRPPVPFSLAPGTEKTIRIQFRPGARMDFVGSATILSNSLGQGQHIVSLTGGGKGPQIQLSPADVLDFGRIAVGESSLKSILVRNVAADNPENSDVLIVNNVLATDGDFRVLSPMFSIAPDDSSFVTIVFGPSVQRRYSEFATFGSNDLQRSILRVGLLGNSVEGLPPAVSNLSPNWSGSPGYTNAAALDVCWDNPGADRDIVELWWKFTPTPVPPQSVTDTTTAGGFQKLGPTSNCASLPLSGQLTSGFWYCYVWFENGIGNSGYENAVSTSFVFDTTAPGTPEVLARSILGSELFGPGQPFSLTLGVPLDPDRGSRDAAEARWKFKVPPESAVDYSGRFVFRMNQEASQVVEIPFEGASLAGDDSLYIWLADSAGNADASQSAIVPYRFSPVGNLSADWSGFDGFTSATDLQICWQVPAEAIGISEIWWKFTQSPAPPETPSDTTSAGGFQAVAGDATCASLPLAGRLTAGLWYCYVWVVDQDSNSGYRDAIPTIFVYDINAPRAPILLGRSIPDLQWFGFNKTFSITLALPVDEGRGVRDAAEARWKFQTPPDNASDYFDKLVFTSTNQSSQAVDIDFSSPDLAGDDSLYVWLADSAGNADIEDLTVIRYRYDLEAPEIRRLRADFDVAILGEAFNDTIVISDRSGVDTAWVRYRFGGATAEEQPRPLDRISTTNRFLLTVPADGITKRGIEYRVVARDLAENTSEDQPDSASCDAGGPWISIRTRVPAPGDFRVDAGGQPVPLLAGGELANYQLFSVPYDLDNGDVLNVLADDLGDYDIKQWRLFDYVTTNEEGQRFQEGALARPFVPGRSYFIISREEDVIIDSGPGVSRRTVCPDSIRLHDGWNLITTPFNFPVSRESLSLVNSNTALSLRSYERGWTTVDIMEPWKGYALFVTGIPDDRDGAAGQIFLVVKPRAAASRASKRYSSFLKHDAGEWSLQVSGSAGELHDVENWAGVRAAATSGYDALDLAEPPVVGPFLKIFFPHREWQLSAKEFSSDFRSIENDQTWELQIATNLPNTLIDLRFDFFGDFSPLSEVFLLDTDLRLSQNLRTSSRYSFKSGEAGIQKTLTLMVGSQAFVSAAAGDIGLVPGRFELLPNFPNPFNPETTIRYNLPEPGKVKIEVFDLLGRRVATLVDLANHEPGFHLIRWNGRDASGRSAATGVYIYRLTTATQSSVRKMVLVR